VIGTTAVLAAAVVLFLATLPPGPRTAAWGGDPGLPARTVAGALHVHTTRSDGAADRAAVAAAAARAGLQFVVFADHGDATRAPEPPAYLDGVLCLDGVEISTNGGHYAVVGLPQAPYPLGGEASAVVEDVARLGGFGFVAHAHSARPDLAWTDWSLPVDGVEWMNGDSEWRDEPRGRLLRALFDYLVRPAPAMASMLDRPVTTLTTWDTLSSRRAIVAVAGHDAHGGIGRGDEGGGWRGVTAPSYEASFRTFTTRVRLERPFSRADAAGDAAALLSALRAGRAFTAVDALAAPAYLDFRASTPAGPIEAGETTAPSAATLEVTSSTVEGAEIVVLHSSGASPGAEIARAPAGAWSLRLDRAFGAYRVEVRLPGAPGKPPVPWVVSNPIYFMTAAPSPPAEIEGDSIPFPIEAPWHVEHDPSSSGSLTSAGAELRLDYRLGTGDRRSQFVALAADVEGGLPDFTGLRVIGRASRPMRLSVQVRYPGDEDSRWGRSVYLSEEPRSIAVARDGMVQMNQQGSAMPSPATARSILFVVDLTNARPGDAGTIELGGLRFVR
jgi:hypothetical protein